MHAHRWVRYGDVDFTKYDRGEKKPCKANSCRLLSATKGYCKRHYSQVRATGKTFISSHDIRPPIIDGEVARIPIGFRAKDGYSLVDTEDIGKIRHNLYLSKGYVAYGENGNTKKLHRLITGVTDSAVQVDHINGDKLDNRKENLRLCNQSQNKANSRPYKNSNLGLKGITRRYGKWVAQLRHDGKHYYLGSYDTPVEAALSYDRKAREVFGGFANLNFPDTQ